MANVEGTLRRVATALRGVAAKTPQAAPLGLPEAVARHAGVLPVPVREIARDVGVEVVEVSTGDPELCGDCYGRLAPRRDGGWRIVLDAGRSETRRRHTVAFLLAHVVYHRDLLGSGALAAANPDALWANAGNRIWPSHRTQANVVAANLLLPRHLIAHTGPGDVETRAAELGVTPNALRIRLGMAVEP